MNILNFMQRFPDKASCIAYLKGQKDNLVSPANIVAVRNIAGTPTNLFSSASTFITGSHYAPEQTWNTASSLSATESSIAISNAKRFLSNVHHNLKNKYLK